MPCVYMIQLASFIKFMIYKQNPEACSHEAQASQWHGNEERNEKYT